MFDRGLPSSAATARSDVDICRHNTVSNLLRGGAVFAEHSHPLGCAFLCNTPCCVSLDADWGAYSKHGRRVVSASLAIREDRVPLPLRDNSRSGHSPRPANHARAVERRAVPGMQNIAVSTCSMRSSFDLKR